MKKELRQYRAVPPKGFVLDQDEPTQSDIKLPQGFTLDSDKKKVGSQNLSTSSNTQGNTNLSLGGEKNQVSQADKNALANFAQNLNKGNGQNVVKKLPTQNQITQVKPKRILTSEEVEKKAQERLNDPYNQLASNNSDDPIGSYYNTIQNSKALSVKGEDKIDDANEAAIHDKMSEMIVNNGFSNAKSASDYLYNQVKKVTGREVPINKVSIDELEKVLPNNLSTEAALKKVAANQYIGSIMDESKNLDDFIQKYPSLSQKFSDINQNTEEGKAQAYNLILNDPDVIEAAKDRPEIWKQYLQERNNFNNKFPDLAYRDVAHRIAQYAQDENKNGVLYTNRSKKGWDSIVEEMFKKGKINAADRAFYYQKIDKGDLPTGDVLDMAWEGYKKATNDIGTTFGLNKVGLATPAEKFTEITPTHNKILGGGAGFIGYVAPMLVGGAELKAAGMGAKGANLLMGMAQFGGSAERQARKYFPDNPANQLAYTMLNVAFNTIALDIPIEGAQKSIGVLLGKEAQNIIPKLTSNSISEAGKEQLKQSFLRKAINVFGKYGVDVASNSAKTAGTLTTLGLLNRALNLSAGDKNAFDNMDLSQEFADYFKMALPLGVLGATSNAISNSRSKEINKPDFTPQEQTAISALIEKDPQQISLKPSIDVLKDANATPEQKKQALKEVYDQLTHPENEAQVGQYLGKAADAVYELPYQNETKNARVTNTTTPTTNETGAEVRDTKDEQAGVNTTDNGLQDGNSGSGKDVGGEKVVVGAKPKPLDENSIAESVKWINDLMSLPDYTRVKDKDGNVYEIRKGKISKLTFNQNGEVIDSETIWKMGSSYGNPDFWNSGYEILKQEANQPTNEIPISTENQSNTIKEANTVEQPTSEGEKTSQPIETEPIRKSNEGQPPSKEPPVESGGGTKPPKGNKALATRLVEASNVSEEAKSGIAEKGLKYEPKSQKEAEQIAKSVIDEIGIDDAVDKARAQTFGGDVNTLIQTEALNRLKELEDAAKTPEEKRAYAEKFAEVSIALDEWARDKAGRGISALNFFYKKSPLGIQIAENVKRGEAFKEWSKNKEQSWKEFFDELRKEPDFEKEVQEVVGKEVKAERAKERAERKEKVHKAIDDTMAKWAKKLKAKGTDDAQKQGIGVDEVFKAAAATMKKAYDAGEAVVKIVNDAIEYISKQLGRDDWGKEEFKKEWEQRLADKKAKKKLTDEELKARVIDKFRKKLKGLSDKEKEEVVRRAFKELVENGALEYDDFKKIISDVTGRGEMTPDEAKRLRELVEQTNNVEKAAKELQEKRTDEAFIRYRTAMLDAAKATKDLNDMLWNKPDVTRRLTSIMQLNTLGIPSLVANVTYNVWNQMLARLPIGIINDTIDRALAGAAKLVGKSYEREYNVWETQGAFFKGLGLGTKESAEQFLTGLNRQDLFQKEIYGQQIRPFRAIRDLFAWGRGKKNLSKQEAVDKSLQATVGIPAELVARALNIGDKPLRFGAESVQGKAFAISLGLKGMDYKLFMEFPKEEAYRAYKKKGLSDAEASKNADYIKAAIEQEGKRSTFQQDNLLNDLLNRMFGGQKSGVGQLAKAVIVSPYIKIPSNAFWSGYNIVNPEIAFLQAMYHGARAFQARNRGDNFSRMQLREARYWFAHGVVGIALRATIIPMVQAGIFNTQNTKDDTKKEREGEQNYEQQGAINLTKLMVYLRGGDPSKIKGGLTLSNRWLGQGGSVANSIARKYEDMTPEQREKQLDFWDYSFGGLEKEGLQELQNGVFSNTSAILTAIDSKGSFGFDQYFRNIAGMMENTAHPAMFAQIERNHLDYVPQYKGDSFIGELKNDILTRSAIVRKLSGRYPPAKISIWGEPLMKPDNTLMRLFGISRTNEGNFAYPIYEDAKKTGDIGFFPPAVSPNLYGQKLNLQQQNVLQTYVGQARKSLIAPYVNDGAYIEGFEKKYSEIKDVEVKKMVLGYLYETGRIQGVKKFLDENPQFKKTDPTTYEEEINDNYDEFKAAVKERQPTE